MPFSNVNANINNVSKDYFLRGVDAAKPTSSAKATEVGQGNEGLPVDAPDARAGKLAARLDVLLMKAAKASTQSLTGRQTD